MHSIFQLHMKKTGKITLLLAFSFFVSGCPTGKEPVTTSNDTIRKETAGRPTKSFPHNTNEAKEKKFTETSKEILKKRSVAFPDYKRSYDYATAQRNPFAQPAELQEQHSFPIFNHKDTFEEASLNRRIIPNHTVTSHNNKDQALQTAPQNLTMIQKVTPYPLEPCVAGIFDNGKEKYALVRWQQVQGIFRCGEPLGNGYYVKEITTNSVLIGSEQAHDDATTIRLTLQ